jgi:glycerol uptake facilitator-like aquaporin
MTPALGRRLFAEFLGTGLLVTVIVGSGIAAQQLSPGQPGLQLLENSTATALGLAGLILMLGPVSGARISTQRCRSRIGFSVAVLAWA